MVIKIFTYYWTLIMTIKPTKSNLNYFNKNDNHKIISLYFFSLKIILFYLKFYKKKLPL